ncbi:hypothetical protein L484_015971 [Morus notabilis]|uniref:Uncharacterized protein n=1 Tax=Morus notabilis TaxID=981085 RepID=W9QW57_9ROSA|nr:hypothetical protein L484_015971 [Morus notabilis]
MLAKENRQLSLPENIGGWVRWANCSKIAVNPQGDLRKREISRHDGEREKCVRERERVCMRLRQLDKRERE